MRIEQSGASAMPPWLESALAARTRRFPAGPYVVGQPVDNYRPILALGDGPDDHTIIALIPMADMPMAQVDALAALFAASLTLLDAAESLIGQREDGLTSGERLALTNRAIAAAYGDGSPFEQLRAGA